MNHMSSLRFSLLHQLADTHRQDAEVSETDIDEIIFLGLDFTGMK